MPISAAIQVSVSKSCWTCSGSYGENSKLAKLTDPERCLSSHR